ncbi:DUF4352 domain-containing protein [Streptococcus oricebi]|uniref:DUF5105 domain-containing protein n=1 Tax=Streptococcus oricebi TaxID=1547447 RepID=A0ABS5B2C2_9STRE|nr:DUF4352 domain-containing protein [Streptococcus oricebi]MBP2622980.1 DUF5105 domain-containing protein [Streptococcus oricebi]
MNKFLKYTATFLAVATLAACSSGAKKASQDGAASNNEFEFRVKEGFYVKPQDESAESDYLALKVEVKNKSKKSQEINNTEFALYDSDDEKIEPVRLYSDDDKFKTLSYQTISKGKTTSGYIVYEVEKGAKYELHFTPTTYDTKSKGKNDLEIKLNTSKYEDNIDQAKEVTQKFVEGVFLNGEASGQASNVSVENPGGQIVALADKEKKSSDKDSSKDSSDEKKDSKKKDDLKVSNNIEKEREDYVAAFAKNLDSWFTYYEPSEAESRTFVQAYMKANAKRAKITYTIKSYLPDKAEVYVRPEVIDVSNLKTSDILSSWVEQNRGQYNNLSDAYKAAEKYILEQAPSKFESTPLTTDTVGDKEGYLLKLTKSKGKWKIDTSDYSYKNLVSAFGGRSY